MDIRSSNNTTLKMPYQAREIVEAVCLCVVLCFIAVVVVHLSIEKKRKKTNDGLNIASTFRFTDIRALLLVISVFAAVVAAALASSSIFGFFLIRKCYG